MKVSLWAEIRRLYEIKKLSQRAILRLFDCDFIAEHGCAVFIGATGTGKSHLLNALGYTACEKGISVRFARVVDMINALMHHGEAIVIQGDSYRMKDKSSDEKPT